MNGTTLLAWQDPSFRGLGQYEQPQEWRLEVDLCGWSRTRDAAVAIVRAHTSGNGAGAGSGCDGEKKGRKKAAIGVDDLLRELEGCGVRYESSLPRRRRTDEEEEDRTEEYKPRRERLMEQTEGQARPQFRQAWLRG